MFIIFIIIRPGNSGGRIGPWSVITGVNTLNGNNNAWGPSVVADNTYKADNKILSYSNLLKGMVDREPTFQTVYHLQIPLIRIIRSNYVMHTFSYGDTPTGFISTAKMYKKTFDKIRTIM